MKNYQIIELENIFKQLVNYANLKKINKTKDYIEISEEKRKKL